MWERIVIAGQRVMRTASSRKCYRKFPRRPIPVRTPGRKSRSIDARQSEAIDAAEIVRIDRLAFSIDNQPAGLGEPHSRAPHLVQMRAPAEFALAASRRMGLGRVDRRNCPRVEAAQFKDRLFDGEG